MKIIISVKWTSLASGRRRRLVTDRRVVTSSQPARPEPRPRESTRLSEDADPLTGQIDFIA